MNGALYRAMVKAHAKMIFGLALGSMFYVLLIIYIYPTLSPHDLNELFQKMPKKLLQVFGIQAGVQNVGDFVASKYYSFLYLIFLMIYSVMMPVQLVARLIDRGSMAYLLSSSLSRTKVLLTQMGVLWTGLGLICLLTFLGGWMGDRWMLDHPELNVPAFLKLNIMGFLLFAVVCGYSLFFSCLLADEKKALSASTTLTILFYACDLAGKLGDSLKWMRNLSIFSLFEPTDIMKGADVTASSYMLLAMATVLSALSLMVFRRKDLSI
jgi:ABC-2 type transport system permease protein